MIERFNETKSDILIMIVGTSPMPNLISACTRVKKDAVIYALHTKETEIIAENLQTLIEEKSDEADCDIEVKPIRIKGDYENPNDVYRELKRVFQCIKDKKLNDEIIELNYTGGNKVISSTAYYLFKKIFKDKNALLTYLDGEKSLININYVDGKKVGIFTYNKANETLEININDIIEIHSHDYKDFNSREFDAFKDEYENLDIHECFYEALIGNLDNRNEFIKFLEPLSLVEKDLMNKANKFNENLKKSGIKLRNYSDIEGIFSVYKTVKGYDSGKKSGLEKILKDLNGIWLEKALFYRLGKLKGNGIDDVVCSLERKHKRGKKAKPEFEVDIIILRNHKLFCISLTIIDEYDKAKFKLYEIKLRAELLAGVEADIAYINFCESSHEFIKVYKDIWDDDMSNTLICAWDRLDSIEERIISWINRGEKNE